MRTIPLFLLVFAFTVTCWVPAGAQDTPRLRVEASRNVTSGTLTEVVTRLEPETEDVISWSISIFLDGLAAVDITTAATDFELLSQGGFAETHLGPDGASYASVGVLSFTDPVALPVGPSTVLKTTCRVDRKDPGEAKVQPRDGFELPEDQPPLKNEVLIRGGALKPLDTQEETLQVEGCAGFTFQAQGYEPAETPGTARVPEGGLLALDVLVHVASDSHLQPSGFSMALKHDDTVLEFESVSFLEDFVQTFVKEDGHHSVEERDGWFHATVLSSTGSPARLPPGEHVALRALYRLREGPAAGEVHTVHFGFTEPPQEAEANPINVFQPLDAIPCSLEDFVLDISVTSEPWIRGDSNADGIIDLSDAVSTLQHLFLGGTARCERAMEINEDGKVDLADPVALLGHLFFGGEPPPAPFPACGILESSLSCEFTACES